FPGRLLRKPDADLDRAPGLVARHRRAAGEARGAAAHFTRMQAAQLAKLTVDANVDDFGVDAIMARQYVDRGAALKEVVCHLGRDFFRIGADAFLADPVIGGKYEQELSPEPRRYFALNDGDAASQLFQLAQASRGLG